MSRPALHVLLVAVLLAACGPRRLAPLPDGWPGVVFVAPIQNETPDLDAPALVRPLLVRAVAGRGYFTLPVGAVDALLAREHLADAGRFAQVAPGDVGPAIGAEGILYATVKDWSSKYVVLTSTVTVTLEAVLVTTAGAHKVWSEAISVSETPQSHGNGGGGLLGALVGAAANAAFTSYRPLAEECVRRLAGGLPPGPLHPVWKEQEGR
jgi:hypothetical protein